MEFSVNLHPFVIPSSQSTKLPTLRAGFLPCSSHCVRIAPHQETPELGLFLSTIPSFPPPRQTSKYPTLQQTPRLPCCTSCSSDVFSGHSSSAQPHPIIDRSDVSSSVSRQLLGHQAIKVQAAKPRAARKQESGRSLDNPRTSTFHPLNLKPHFNPMDLYTNIICGVERLQRRRRASRAEPSRDPCRPPRQLPGQGSKAAPQELGSEASLSSQLWAVDIAPARRHKTSDGGVLLGGRHGRCG